MNSDMVKPKKFGHLLLVYHFTVNQLGCLRKYFLLHILGNFSMINYLIINFIAERVGLDTFYGPDLFQKFSDSTFSFCSTAQKKNKELMEIFYFSINFKDLLTPTMNTT